ncbi:MAG: hypothetical protein RID42_17890 [Alphaproteobacteria bacterium]
MPRVRDILVHVRVEQAQRQRKCRRNTAHLIAKGEMCLVVKTGATNDDYSYSRAAAKAMLDAAWTKMQGLYAGLDLAPPG